MKKQTKLATALAALMSLSLLVPAFAAAQTGGAAVETTVTTPAAGVTISASVMTRAKAKADKEIDRRVSALGELSVRVSAMNKVSDTFKQALSTNVQAQITTLSALKAKIDADTDGATLKADIQSMAQSYRIFALVIPQGRIAAAADREATLINMFIGIGNKIQARIGAAQAAGADVTALAATLADLGVKLTDAQTHAQAAVTGSATLTPDEGDKTKMAANTAALKQANTDIQAAHKSLQDARKDVATLIKGLQALNASASNTTTVQTQ